MSDQDTFVDIDGTICNTSGTGYANAVPIPEAIAFFNSLYDAGHHIVYWTARGAVTKKDWMELTHRQLRDWGVKYHELRFDKPAFARLYDDRAHDWRDEC